MISHVHAAAARHLNMEITAVASRSNDRRRRRSQELGVRSLAYDELPAGGDIVIVATPPAVHFDHVVHNVERGAAVLVEKPLATTLNEADRLVSISKRYPHRILYAENLAFAPVFHHWISHIRRIGEVEHLSARMHQGSPTWGDFLEPHWGGGVLFDLGVHPIALLVLTARAIGAGEVHAVSAHLSGGATDEHAEVTLVFTNGSRAEITVSWMGADVPHWSFQAASRSDAMTMELMPEVLLEHNGDLVPIAPPRTNPPMIESLGYIDQLRSFRADLESGSDPWMNVEFGRWILEIVCACYVSASHGAEVTSVPSGCDRMLTPWQLWRGDSAHRSTSL